jgi:predicted RNA-binding Zn ribbon-like protein
MTMNQPALFIADAPGIDFLNSVATPVDVPIDWISDGQGLVDWLGQARLVPADRLAEIVARATPGELDRVAGQARDLREWFRTFVRHHSGGRPVGADAMEQLAPLNRLLERDEAYGQVVVETDAQGREHLALGTERRWRSPESLLIPIGEEIARVIVADDFTRIRACEGPHCTLMFVDRTRARARRWCSMGVCGNRAKVAAHRVRKRVG